MFSIKRTLIIIIFIFAASFSAALLFIKLNIKNETNTIKSQALEKVALPVDASTSTKKEDEIASQISPDGTKLVNMNTHYESDGVKTFTFSVTDATDSANFKDPFYINVADSDTVMEIPFNTFATDKRFVFIKEVTPENINYLVFRVDGKPLVDDAEFVNVNDEFINFGTEFALRDITGWAGQNLLILRTDGEDGKSGPSFWFNVVDNSFIRLSTKF